MNKECLWYNGEVSCYELLDFDPNGLTKDEIINKAWEILVRKYGFNDMEERDKAMETLYLLDVDNLEKVK